jgi:hypothetical protein
MFKQTIMHYYFRNILLHAVFLAYGSLAYAQLPNEKFGKPSNKEWEFVGWSDAVDADAVILCRTMKASYLLPNYLYILGQESPDGIPDNHPDFGNYQTKESDICVEYEFKLRTKILKPDGAKHANIDITYFDAVDDILLNTDEISDLKIMVFTKNKKGKVEKRSIKTDSFVKERVNDNYMVMHVVVPDVQAGCIIEYQYKITSFRHTFLYDWVFKSVFQRYVQNAT